MSDGHGQCASAVSVQRHQHNAVRNTLGVTFMDMSLLVNISLKSYTYTWREFYLDRHILIRPRSALHRLVNSSDGKQMFSHLLLLGRVITAPSGEETN